MPSGAKCDLVEGTKTNKSDIKCNQNTSFCKGGLILHDLKWYVDLFAVLCANMHYAVPLPNYVNKLISTKVTF